MRRAKKRICIICGREATYSSGWCCIQCPRWKQHTVFCDKRQEAKKNANA